MSKWKTLPDDYHGVRRALSSAVARGDRATAQRLTKKAMRLHLEHQAQLFGSAGEVDNGGRPFNDSLDDVFPQR